MSRTFTFDKMTTDDGVSECYFSVDGERVGSLSRERPARYRADAGRGMVADRNAAWIYSADIDGACIEIPDGSTLREAKRLVERAAFASA